MPFTIPNHADAFHAFQASPDSVDFDILNAAHDRDGVISGCAVTSNSDMTVAVASGTISVSGVTASVTGTNVTIGTADTSNPRFDLVVSNSSGTLSVTAGTASSVPVFPAIPATSVVLAVVYVPTNDTVIAANQITDKRVILDNAALVNLVDDATPQLGGTLDMQTNLLAGNGGTTGIAISANGEVTMTAQPAFLAYNSASDVDVTGNGTVATVDLDTEVFDQNADFAADTFTAPVAGRYLMCGSIHISNGLTTASTDCVMRIVASNRTAFFGSTPGLPDGTAGNIMRFNGSIIVDMDAADTATLALVISGEGSDVVDIEGAADARTSLSGMLVA